MKYALKRVLTALTAVSVLCSAAFVFPENPQTVKADTTVGSGDVNCDGNVTVSDAVMLQGWLLCASCAELTSWEAADLCRDNIINAFDLCLLKRKLISENAVQPTAENTVTAIAYNADVVTLYNTAGQEVTEPSNVKVNGTAVTILLPGVYDISGASDSAQLVVDVDKTLYPEGVVELALKGVNLSNSSDSPVYIAQIGDEVEISAKNGYDNFISDGTDYVNADGDMGAIYACDDLKIKGKGNLTIDGNGGDGIVCKNDLKIHNGNITVHAKDDGIRGKDSVTIGDADDTDFSKLNVKIYAGADGVKSTEEEVAEDGRVTVNGGTVSIYAGDDGIHAISNLTIHNGTVNIEKSVEALEAAKIYIHGGNVFMNASDDGVNATVGAEIECYNGEAVIQITGGTTEVISKGDALDSNGDILIEGGEVFCHGPGNTIFGYGALDYMNKAEITGGRFIAFTSSGKAFSDTSAQPSFNLGFTDMLDNAVFELQDENGTVIASGEAKLPIDCIIVSIPELTVGSVYTATVNDITATVRQRAIVVKAKAQE